MLSKRACHLSGDILVCTLSNTILYGIMVVKETAEVKAKRELVSIWVGSLSNNFI